MPTQSLATYFFKTLFKLDVRNVYLFIDENTTKHFECNNNTSFYINVKLLIKLYIVEVFHFSI